MPTIITVTAIQEPDNDRHSVVVRQGDVSTTLSPTFEFPEELPQSVTSHRLLLTLNYNPLGNIYNLIFSEVKIIIDGRITLYGDRTVFKEVQVEFGVPKEVELPS